jgi:hypothetical protein
VIASAWLSFRLCKFLLMFDQSSSLFTSAKLEAEEVFLGERSRYAARSDRGGYYLEITPALAAY